MRIEHGFRIGLAALALGLALGCPALAKTPWEPARQPQAQNASRMTEIMIELAWLADPMTFPFYLQARVQGPALHVRGFVLNAAVRDQALRLARLRCPMNVIDELSLRPGLAVPTAVISPSHLEKSALAALDASLPGIHFHTTADRAGRIKVEGQVHSFEEKLVVSQGLRRIHGCTAVINQVHVVEASQTPPDILAAGSKNEMKAASLTGPLLPDQPKPKSPPLATMSPVLPDQPNGESPPLASLRPAQMEQSNPKSLPLAFISPLLPYQPEAEPSALLRNTEPNRPSPAASTQHEMEAAPTTGAVPSDQPEPESPAVVKNTEPDRASPTATAGHEMEPVSATSPPAPDQAKPESPALVNSPEGDKSDAAVAAASDTPPVEAEPASKTARQLSPAIPTDETNTTERSEGKNWNVGPAWEDTSEQSSPLLVTHGTLIEMDESMPPTPADPAERLRKIIASSCGISEHILQVRFKSALDVQIHIQGNNQEEANALALRIFQLPELRPYRLDIQVTIPR